MEDVHIAFMPFNCQECRVLLCEHCKDNASLSTYPDFVSKCQHGYEFRPIDAGALMFKLSESLVADYCTACNMNLSNLARIATERDSVIRHLVNCLKVKQ